MVNQKKFDQKFQDVLYDYTFRNELKMYSNTEHDDPLFNDLKAYLESKKEGKIKKSIVEESDNQYLTFNTPLPFDLKSVFTYVEETDCISFSDSLKTDMILPGIGSRETNGSGGVNPILDFLQADVDTPQPLPNLLETENRYSHAGQDSLNTNETKNFFKNNHADSPNDAITCSIWGGLKCIDLEFLIKQGVLKTDSIQNTIKTYGKSTKRYKRILSEFTGRKNSKGVCRVERITKEDLIVFLYVLHLKKCKIFIKYRLLFGLLCLGPSTLKELYDFVYMNYTDLGDNWKANIRYQLSIHKLFYKKKGSDNKCLWCVESFQ